MNAITSESFQKFYWLTPYQLRDMYIEEACLTSIPNTKVIQEIKNLAAGEQSTRKSLPDQFVECPYCRGYHKGFDNNEKLCEKCEWTVHILRWDIEHNKNLTK